MKTDNISVFYSNIKDAASSSGKSINEILNILKNEGVFALDFDISDLQNAPADFAVNSIYAFIDFTLDGSLEEGKRVIEKAKEAGSIAMLVPELLDENEAKKLKADPTARQLYESAAAVKTVESLEKLAFYGHENGVPVAVENFDSHRSLTERGIK